MLPVAAGVEAGAPPLPHCLRCNFGPCAVRRDGRPEVAAEVREEAVQNVAAAVEVLGPNLVHLDWVARRIADCSGEEQVLAVMRVVLAVV